MILQQNHFFITLRMPNQSYLIMEKWKYKMTRDTMWSILHAMSVKVTELAVNCGNKPNNIRETAGPVWSRRHHSSVDLW